MKKLSLAFVSVATLGLAMGAAFAQIKSGLQVGERCPAFNVTDVSGPTTGATHCHI